jgi:F-type H+-transporting ATPase subunit delta
MDKHKAPADKYAKALFSTIASAKRREAALSDLETLAQAVKNAKAQKFFNSPVIDADKKIALYREACASKFSSPEVDKFVMLLLQNGRFSSLEKIIGLLRSYIEEQKGVVSGKAEFAAKPDAAYIKDLKQRLKGYYGKDVRLIVSENPSLLGGMRLYVGSSMFDFTLDARLKALSSYVKKAS